MLSLPFGEGPNPAEPQPNLFPVTGEILSHPLVGCMIVIACPELAEVAALFNFSWNPSEL